MADRLTVEELERLIELTTGRDDVAMRAGEKLRTALEWTRQTEGSAIGESFPAELTFEEAREYSDRGERMMQEATQCRVDEKTHADLCCVSIGLVTSLCQTLPSNRAPFCRQLVNNVIFAALKAAYRMGKSARAEGTSSGP